MIASEQSGNQKNWLKWLPLYLILCVSYLIFINTDYSLQFLHKAAAILMLLLPVLKSPPTKGRAFLCLAIGFSACGDMLLASDLPMQFELGLGAFLIAHLAYVVVMWPAVRLQAADRVPLVAVALVFIALCGWILPYTGQMLVPVATYMAVIGVMAFCALLSKVRNVVLILGAGVFVISDSMIAINKFITPLPGAQLMIMITYYSAQFMLVFALIHQARKV